MLGEFDGQGGRHLRIGVRRVGEILVAAGVLVEALTKVPAQYAQGPHGLLSPRLVKGDGQRFDVWPGLGRPRRLEAQHLLEARCGGIPGGEGFAQIPDRGRVASREVCRYSSVHTVFSGTHGDTTTAGTR